MMERHTTWLKPVPKPSEQGVSMTQTEALRLALEALEKLWNIIDDIDTYSDMAKADEKLYRSLVERRQRQRFEETGISTDGYELHGGAITAIKAALEAKDEPWEKFCDSHCVWTNHHPDCKLAQRTWVGLTDDEIVLIVAECAASHQHTDIHFAKAIEAKLKEKNT
jgi:deoxyribodipyrimidine photolyase